MLTDNAVPLGDALAAADAALRAGGITPARREALILLGALRAEATGAAIASGVAHLPREQAEALLRLAERRGAGEPLAYVIGRAGFRHLDLEVTPDTLIPRPETEGLVDRAAALTRRVPGGLVADVGTGTGCIAISLASELGIPVVGTDISRPALAVAERNAQASRVAVRLVQADLVSAFTRGAVGVLVSNPPYLSAAEHARLDPGVRKWEPASALASGADGMEATRRLLDEGRRVVTTGGWIALELDSTRGADSARCAAELGWSDISIDMDLFGRDRYLLARRSEA